MSTSHQDQYTKKYYWKKYAPLVMSKMAIIQDQLTKEASKGGNLIYYMKKKGNSRDFVPVLKNFDFSRFGGERLYFPVLFHMTLTKFLLSKNAF